VKAQDLDAVGLVIEQALAGQRAVLQALIEQRTAQCLSAERAVEVTRDLVDEAEQRLRSFLERQASDNVLTLRTAASAELLRVQEVFLDKLRVAEELARELAGLREQLRAVEQPRSAYDLAVQEGFEGSQSEWLHSLRGDPAKPPTAYEVARALVDDEQMRQAVSGQDGRPGVPGAGIEAPQWAPGIFREGALVQAYVGQYYRALRDTSAEPYGSADWARVGSSGFHVAPAWAEGRTYRSGDLVSRDYSTFLVNDAGELVLFAARGPRGEPGKQGDPGRPGTNGRDGAGIETMELRGSVLALVMRSAGGELSAHTVDLFPALEKLGEALQEVLFARLCETFARGES